MDSAQYLFQSLRSFQVFALNIVKKALPLYIFSLFEVFAFKLNIDIVYSVVGLFEYVYIIALLFLRTRLGVLYYVGFTLLSLNMSNFLHVDGALPMTFFGMRVFGLSVNFLVLFLAAALVFIRRNKYNLVFSRFELGVLVYVYYTCFLGALLLVLGVHYADNLYKDLTVYLCIVPMIVILRVVSRKELAVLFTHIFFSTALLLFSSFVLGAFRQYAIGEDILLVNTFGTVFLFMLFHKDVWEHKYLALMIVLFYVFCFAQNLIIFGGKTFIFIFLFLLWRIKNNLNIKVLIVSLPILVASPYLLTMLRSYFGEGAAISNKIGQIQMILSSLGLHQIALHKSSIGNVIGELLTLKYILTGSWSRLFFGQGIGSGIYDVFGYLKWWAGNNGYALVDSERGVYHKLHLAIYEILLKGGLLFWIPYCWICLKAFFVKRLEGFLFFILALFMVSVSKEFLLLTLCLNKLGSDGKV